MKTGFRLVAKLGAAGDGYPHVLIDAYGWSVRFGPSRTEQKYYSNVPSLLNALIEHSIRRQLRECPVLKASREMLSQIQAALDRAEAQGLRLAGALAQVSPTRRLHTPHH